MSTTKAKLLESFPGMENQLSPEGREALLQALQKGNGDSFIVIRSGDSKALMKSFEERGIRYVTLSEADAAVFFENWENSPLHTIIPRDEGVSLFPMLIVHEAAGTASSATIPRLREKEEGTMELCMSVINEQGAVCGKQAEYFAMVSANPYSENEAERRRTVRVRYCREHWDRRQLLLHSDGYTVDWYALP